MKEIERYMPTMAVITKDKELIPLWDKRVTVRTEERYDCEYIEAFLDGERYQKEQVIECVFDTFDKVLSMGIELEYYPSKGLEYQIGEVVYAEIDYRTMEETTITDVIFEEYDLTISKGKDLEHWWKNEFAKEISKNGENVFYCIKSWKPTFVMANGKKTIYTHQIKHKK